jgi:hypothetical protein
MRGLVSIRRRVWIALMMGAASGELASVAGCGGLPPSVYTPVSATADTALFRVVVQSIPTLPKVPSRVDPRMLRADQELHGIEPNPHGSVRGSRAEFERMMPRSIFFPDSTHLVPLPARVLRLRADVLRRLGVQETDALADVRCPGATAEWLDKSPCPREGQYRSAIMAEAQERGAYWPGVVDERESGRAAGHWTVRVTERTMTEEGSATTAVDYVLARDPATRAWRLVKRVSLVIVE